MREPDKTMWKLEKSGWGRGRVGGDNIRPICFVAHTGVSQHKVGKCSYKPYLQFHGFVPNQVVFVVVVLQILSIMGGGVEGSTLTWPSHRSSPWLYICKMRNYSNCRRNRVPFGKIVLCTLLLKNRRKLDNTKKHVEYRLRK